MNTIDQLHEFSSSDGWVPPVDVALSRAREELALYGSASIHDHQAMMNAAISLDHVLRNLVAALDAEAGR
ncbi:hypothetical protein [Streptomyces sp. NPDC059076]|uniref:hypothetical protein n=1 Tax=unclassified Streptomyces TaxID=2593676 RepID=UPI00367AF0E4